MIIYNVTVKVDPQTHEEWLQWMKTKHIPEVIATGFFIDHKIFRLLDLDENDGVTYAIQYFCTSMEDYREYQKNHAPALQQEHSKRYQNKFVAFRSLLQQV